MKTVIINLIIIFIRHQNKGAQIVTHFSFCHSFLGPIEKDRKTALYIVIPKGRAKKLGRGAKRHRVALTGMVGTVSTLQFKIKKIKKIKKGLPPSKF